ncbi:hypothetical protein ABKV19_000433 [Rosa sericea]
MVSMAWPIIFVFAPASVFITAMSVICFTASAYAGFSEVRGKHLECSKFWKSNSNQSDSQKSKQINISGVQFVHKYSGGMALDTAIFICLSYFTSTATMIYAQHLNITQGIREPQIDLKYPGILLFLLGISGNFYHHYLLSRMRSSSSSSPSNSKSNDDKDYKIPRGGLFELVVCPHYLFEIIGFLGFSFISQTFYAFAFAVGTAFYLTGRSYATRRWYLSKFKHFPQNVKALIPYLL